jgi:hypothetical protein
MSGTVGGHQWFLNQSSNAPVDRGTKIEHIRNITEQEADMTDFLRDMAAFTSIVMFVTSCAVLLITF